MVKDRFSFPDEREYRSCVVWLENQKIRLYKIEDRDLLTDIDSGAWPDQFKKVSI